jgi:hypothetical protein
MPLNPPEWLKSHAKALISGLVPLARGPFVTALLERAGLSDTYDFTDGELSLDESEKLMLCLYWVSEYRDKRISPAELLYTLAHITSNLLTEV